MTFNNQPVPPPFCTAETISPVSLFREFYRIHCKSSKDRTSTSDSVLSQNEFVCSYDHGDSWTNRIIYGESLQVMNSLLHYESLGGKIQMIYFDPPFGIDFDARFHPFETALQASSKVRTYRDNWAGGLVSYLKYLKERLKIAKKLLHPQGSIFVQISDANVHHVRVILDEIFGAQNFCSMITFRTGTSLQSRLLASVSDYLLWYAKDKDQCFSVPLFRERFWHEKVRTFDWIKLPDGHNRRLTSKERDGTIPPPQGSLFKVTQITRKCRPGETPRPIRFKGREFLPPPGLSYPGYVNELVHQDRVIAVGSRLYGVRYESDFPFIRYTNLWNDTVRSTFASRKNYPVQTNPKVIERCMLMATRPGDIVLDPTGGSGTTAYIAEKWGRRWVSVDYGKIPRALTRQKLLTSPFELYTLNNEKQGVRSGFKYEQRQDKLGREVGGFVPHITRGTLTSRHPPKMERIVDRPVRVPGVVRVPGPFVVQSSLRHDVEYNSHLPSRESNGESEYLEAMITTLQAVSSMQMGTHTIRFQDIEPVKDEKIIHAVGKQVDSDRSVAFSFGSKHEAIKSVDIQTINQSVSSDEFKRVFLIGFDFKAGVLDFFRKTRPPQEISIIPVSAPLDLHMGSLLMHHRASELFEILPIPKVQLNEKKNLRKDDTRFFQIEILGLSFIDPRSGNHLALSKGDIAAWFLDPSYDGSVFKIRQAFFLQNEIWKPMAKRIKGKLPTEAWKTLSSMKSWCFTAKNAKKAAVKVIDRRGNEVEATKDLPA